MPFSIPDFLNLWGIKPSVLADGSEVYNLVCVGKARFLGQEKFGEITLTPTGTENIVGMEFVNAFGFDVLLRPGKEIVFMPPSATPPQKDAEQTQETAEATTTTPPSQSDQA